MNIYFELKQIAQKNESHRLTCPLLRLKLRYRTENIRKKWKNKFIELSPNKYQDKFLLMRILRVNGKKVESTLLQIHLSSNREIRKVKVPLFFNFCATKSYLENKLGALSIYKTSASTFFNKKKIFLSKISLLIQIIHVNSIQLFIGILLIDLSACLFQFLTKIPHVVQFVLFNYYYKCSERKLSIN